MNERNFFKKEVETVANIMCDQRELMKVKRELDKIPSQGWEMAH